MKNKDSFLMKFLCVFVVVFCGISAILPQKIQDEDEITMPVWSDLPESDRDFIREAYGNNLIAVYGGDEFGADAPYTMAEALYSVIRLYEDKNDMENTFNGFSKDAFDDYLKKAKEYDLISKNVPEENIPIKREDMAYLLAPVMGGSEETADFDFSGKEKFKSPPEVIKLYKEGIALSKRITSAYSPDIELNRCDAAKLFAMCSNPSMRAKTTVLDYSPLEGQIRDKMALWQGDWSLYFENYDTGAVVSINSHQVYSASLIKLFVAQTVYQKIADGSIEATPKIEDEERKMLAYSDNDAWKYLARLLGGGSYSKGMSEVTKLASYCGFNETGQFYQGSHKNYNFTSVRDCGVFLSRLMDGTIISRAYSDKILEFLKQQQHKQKIPAGVPESVQTANKTGELDYVQGDAAIVYSPNGTYILVIIGDGLDNSYGEIDKITELSASVYEFVNKE